MTRRTVLSLFSGAGGLDLGLEAAGFEIVHCIELDSDCRKTLTTNKPDWTISKNGNIHAVAPAEVLAATDLAQGDLTLLAGGPPCQPFSKASYWRTGDTKRLADPRATTLDAFLDYVELALPRTLLLENVKGLVFNGKDEALFHLEKRLDCINQKHGVDYNTTVVSLNAVDFGVPQKRERIFLVADRAGREFVQPAPTHSQDGPERWRTAWDALGDLQETGDRPDLSASGKWADLLPSIPEGQNYLWHTARAGGEPLFGWRRRYWSFLLKLAKNRPSWTIPADPGPSTGPFHWQNRHLSIRELCRLQTFPDSYHVSGSYRSGHRQTGNAVPPAIGHILGHEIRVQLLDDEMEFTPRFIPPARGDCPAAEEVQPVPKKFLKLRGTHPEHPGTGKGPGALKRRQQES